MCNYTVHFFHDHLFCYVQGSTYSPAKLPPKPLEIWAYEVSFLNPSSDVQTLMDKTNGNQTMVLVGLFPFSFHSRAFNSFILELVPFFSGISLLQICAWSPCRVRATPHTAEVNTPWLCFEHNVTQNETFNHAMSRI